MEKQEPIASETIEAEGKAALMRSLLNGIICLLDFMPGLGIGFPLLADLAKFGRQTDLTPHVPKKIAFGLLLFEIPFGSISLGMFPSYLIPAVWQLLNDWPKIKRYFFDS